MLFSAAARLTFFVLALSLVGCDHATKHWAETSLRGGPHVELVPGALDLRYAANDDVAFGLLRFIPVDLRMPLILALGALLIGAVGFHGWRRRRQGGVGRLEQLAYTLVLAGAVGNVVDRLFRGYVVDFIHLHHWPIFNVADVAIVAGGVLLAWQGRAAWRSPPPEPPAMEGA